ncbi:MAG: hypothetical protein GKR77_04195 [Legionellales bacterium]|nr:hypothetical protein [Legionellales bacterium]
MINIYLPYRLGQQIEHHDPIAVSATTIKTALQQLLRQYPQLDSSIWVDARTQQLTGYTQLFVNQQQVTDLDAQLQAGDQLHLVQAMAGG